MEDKDEFGYDAVILRVRKLLLLVPACHSEGLPFRRPAIPKVRVRVSSTSRMADVGVLNRNLISYVGMSEKS